MKRKEVPIGKPHYPFERKIPLRKKPYMRKIRGKSTIQGMRSLRAL